jgi:AAA family ATP:ADP antiporter
MFSVFVVAQFWAFAADVFSDAEGRRLMPMIAIGATAGAASGAKITEFLVKGGFADVLASLGLEPLAALARQTLRTEALLLVACLPLGASILITRWVDAKRSVAEPIPGGAEGEKAPEGPAGGGLSLVLSNRFLLAVALITVLLNWVNTNGENLLFRVVQDVLAGEAAEQGIAAGAALIEFTKNGTTAFYGNFFSWVNAVALVLQALVASRLLKYGGFAPLLLLLPVVALTSYATMALLPVLAVVKGMKIAENATDYSINNTARHVLWLPVASELKLKGKPTIDALFARVGDGMAALTAVIGATVWALATEVYFVFNVLLIIIWLVLSVRIVKDHKQLVAAQEAGSHE